MANFTKKTKLALKTIYKSLLDSELYDGAAALSFYFTFSLFPGLIVLFLFANYFLPVNVENYDLWLIQSLPEAAKNLIGDVLSATTGKDSLAIASVSFLFAVWSASNGIAAAIRQSNISYKVEDKRSFFKVRFIAFLITGGVGLFAVAPMIFSAAWEVFLFIVPYDLPVQVEDIFLFKPIKYSVMTVMLMMAFSIFYYFGPAAKTPFRFFSPGGMFGALTLVVSTRLFEIYLEAADSYARLYGSIGAVMILMMWLYLLGLLLLLGADINRAYYLQKIKRA